MLFTIFPNFVSCRFALRSRLPILGLSSLLSWRRLTRMKRAASGSCCNTKTLIGKSSSESTSSIIPFKGCASAPPKMH